MPLVVNWFQIMFLFLVRQPLDEPLHNLRGCELISNYVLIFGSTTNKMKKAPSGKLWIDFKLCSYFWFDNINKFYQLRLIVVNWFQIMFLFLVRQQFPVLGNSFVCCELISNYVLIFGSTTLGSVSVGSASLWIDFKLCSYFWFDNQFFQKPM